jgi:hypothetical protein
MSRDWLYASKIANEAHQLIIHKRIGWLYIPMCQLLLVDMLQSFRYLSSLLGVSANPNACMHHSPNGFSHGLGVLSCRDSLVLCDAHTTTWVAIVRCPSNRSTEKLTGEMSAGRLCSWISVAKPRILLMFLWFSIYPVSTSLWERYHACERLAKGRS